MSGKPTHFDGRDIAAITNEDVIKWKDTLTTEKRTGKTVNGIWLNAAHTVFEYALTNKKIASNPFDGVRVSGARILFSRDVKLHADFKNKRFIDPKGRIYQDHKHKRVLDEVGCSC